MISSNTWKFCVKFWPSSPRLLSSSHVVTNTVVRRTSANKTAPNFHRFIDHLSHSQPTPRMRAEAETAVIPRTPQEVINEILGHLAADSDLGTLRSCALVSKSWVPSCRPHLFRTVTFGWADMERWLKTFPVPEDSPAHLVRDLGIRIERGVDTPKAFEYTPWFTNVERVTLSAQHGWPLYIDPYWRLPQSTISLTIDVDVIDLAGLVNLMTGLPNLDNLSLSGTFLLNRFLPLEAETDPRGRFGGRLRLIGGLADETLMETLLDIPTGLRFTEVEIRCTRNSLLPTVRLVEGCSQTLVKLSYTISLYSKYHSSQFNLL